jgi:hypothetical protein
MSQLNTLRLCAFCQQSSHPLRFTIAVTNLKNDFALPITDPLHKIDCFLTASNASVPEHFNIHCELTGQLPIDFVSVIR